MKIPKQIFEMTYEKVDSENLTHRSKECIQYISETMGKWCGRGNNEQGGAGGIQPVL